MTEHRKHALHLLNQFPDLSKYEAQFLGQVSVLQDLSPKQAAWLARIMKARGLSPIAEGGAHD